MRGQLIQRLAGILYQIPGFTLGLLKTQQGGVGTFAKLLIRTLTFTQCCSIAHHIQNVILNLECQTDTFCVSVQYRQGFAPLFTRAQGAQTNGCTNQCARFMAMNTLQLFQINLTSFRFQIQCLTATHTGDAAGHCQFRDHRQTVTVGHFGHRRIAQNRERQGLQGIPRQNGIRFAKLDVAGWLATTQIVVVHGRQIIMDQRVGMDALNGGCRGIQRVSADTKHVARGVDQKRTQALSTQECAIVHGFNQWSVLKRLWLNKTAQCIVGTRDACLKLVGEIHLLGVRCEWRSFSVFAVGQQDLHALLGLLQFDLPLARQLHAALEFIERLFQR
ncbi:hypothetical protein EcWSU1_00943 [Enterobacter ludwigii]|uniref:Uncharacterized protein n=1 Tax=Enterobacter ludwigii TaxID=299767 RepID=G8LPT0_9ENTR|nr:hypothetical protein EcWSU1_00943 [Enterobacter ludwigii]